MSSSYDPWLDDTLLRQNLAQHFVKMKQEEKEKKETMKKECAEYCKADTENTRELVKKVMAKKKETRYLLDEKLHQIRSYFRDVDAANKTIDATTYKLTGIKNVIFNDPATIVFWTDGTKTVVKAQGNDIFDPEKGLAMAMAKKFLGNQGNYYNEFAKWMPKEEVESEQPMGKVIRTVSTNGGFMFSVELNEPLKMELLKGGPSPFEEWLDNRDKAMNIRNSLNMRKKPRGR